MIYRLAKSFTLAGGTANSLLLLNFAGEVDDLADVALGWRERGISYMGWGLAKW
jgi:hypothetical protein